MDFEDLLDLNYIRKEELMNQQSKKNQKEKGEGKIKPKMAYCLPLLLRHVNLLGPTCFYEKLPTLTTYHGTIQFRCCLICGRIMSKNTNDVKLTKFVLDDYSDTIQIWAFDNYLCEAKELRNELESVEQDYLGQNGQDIISNMKNILSNTIKQLDYCHIPLGSKVLVCGKPSLNKDRIIIKANFIFQLTTSQLDIELAFKQYLIEEYKTMFF